MLQLFHLSACFMNHSGKAGNENLYIPVYALALLGWCFAWPWLRDLCVAVLAHSGTRAISTLSTLPTRGTPFAISCARPTGGAPVATSWNAQPEGYHLRYLYKGCLQKHPLPRHKTWNEAAPTCLVGAKMRKNVTHLTNLVEVDNAEKPTREPLVLTTEAPTNIRVQPLPPFSHWL